MNYGGEVSVTSLDVRVAPRHVARLGPHVCIGRWTNAAEILVLSGVCKYKTFNVEDALLVQSRMDSGLHDRALLISPDARLLFPFFQYMHIIVCTEASPS